MYLPSYNFLIHQWAPQHQGLSCEKFREWQLHNNPEYQTAKLENLLGRNKIGTHTHLLLSLFCLFEPLVYDAHSCIGLLALSLNNSLCHDCVIELSLLKTYFCIIIVTVLCSLFLCLVQIKYLMSLNQNWMRHMQYFEFLSR